MPFADMMRLTVLESWQSRAIVLAEDLGTVPEGFRATLASRGLLGMSVLWFERRGEGFMPPAQWRRESAGMTSTHDVPTVAGWWRGTDIGWREHIGLAGDDWATRVDQRAHLWWVVQDSGSASGSIPPPEASAEIADALAAHLGSTQAELALLPMEDALALDQQPNLPGTIDEHPNWRRVLPGDAATLLDDDAVAARLSRLNHRRHADVPTG
jgi:4-alpha-glucanotransferase